MPNSTGIEIINGHTYLVTRDPQNNILRLEGRDPRPAPPAAEAAALVIAAKAPGDVTAAEQAQLVQFITGRLKST